MRFFYPFLRLISDVEEDEQTTEKKPSDESFTHCAIAMPIPMPAVRIGEVGSGTQNKNLPHPSSLWSHPYLFSTTRASPFLPVQHIPASSLCAQQQ